MRCCLLLLMIAVSVCRSVLFVGLSVTRLNSAARAVCVGVIRCSLCQIALASCLLLVVILIVSVRMQAKFCLQVGLSLQRNGNCVCVTAVGCPTFRLPDSVTSGGAAWIQQDSATATVRCNQTDETWFLRCDGRRWKGSVGNCSVSSQCT